MRKSLGLYKTHRRSESKSDEICCYFVEKCSGASSLCFTSASAVEAQIECTGWDPKDGELCEARLKPEETLVEDRSGSNVQIDRRSFV